MGTTFKQLYNKLRGSIDVVPITVCKELINQALRNIYDEHDWSFLWQDSYLRTPARITGTGSVIKFQDTVTLDLATKILVNAIIVDDIPLEERQLKFVTTSKVDRSILYKITNYDNITGIITFDPPFFDDDNSAISLQIVKAYYTAPFIIINGDPIINFRRWAYVHSPQFRTNLNLNTTISEINSIDADRTFTGDPIRFIAYGNDSNGNILFELHPTPINERVYRTRYLSNGGYLTRDSETISDLISTELVLSYAKQLAYEWVMANASKLNLKSISAYPNLIALAMNKGKILLANAINRDEELFPQAYVGDFTDYPCYDDNMLFDWAYTHNRVVIDLTDNT